MNPPKESSTKNTKGTNKTAFVRAFRAFRGLYFLPSDQIFDGMLFLRTHLSRFRLPDTETQPELHGSPRNETLIMFIDCNEIMVYQCIDIFSYFFLIPG